MNFTLIDMSKHQSTESKMVHVESFLFTETTQLEIQGIKILNDETCPNKAWKLYKMYQHQLGSPKRAVKVYYFNQ